MSNLGVIELIQDDFFNEGNQLRQKSKPVEDFGGKFQRKVDNLIKIFENYEIAVGLAAPQIGYFDRFLIININENKTGEHIIMVNPEIEYVSGRTKSYNETCLSLPGFRGKVKRKTKLKVTFLDRNRDKQELEAKDFFARVILHEIDHLDGILFVDRMDEDDELEAVDYEWK